MLRLLGWILKISLFATLVLVLGNLVHWKGRTISDQVKSQISHAEKSDLARKAKSFAMGYPEWSPEPARKESRESRRQLAPAVPTESVHAANGHHPALASVNAQRATNADSSAGGSAAEQIAPSERQKLRALIRELNGHGSEVSGN